MDSSLGVGGTIQPTRAMSVIVISAINITGVIQGHLSSRENRNLSEATQQAGREHSSPQCWGFFRLPSQHVASRAGNPRREPSRDLMVTDKDDLGSGSPCQGSASG